MAILKIEPHAQAHTDTDHTDSGDHLLRDGSTTLTADWFAGTHEIRTGDLATAGANSGLRLEGASSFVNFGSASSAGMLRVVGIDRILLKGSSGAQSRPGSEQTIVISGDLTLVGDAGDDTAVIRDYSGNAHITINEGGAGTPNTSFAYATTVNSAFASVNAGPSLSGQNTTDAASNRVLTLLSGNRATPANNDEGYIAFWNDNSDGNLTEFSRLSFVATDVTAASKDGALEFAVMKANSLTKILTIDGTGITAVGDVGGTTIGGITTANLVDKADTETITALWTHKLAGNPLLLQNTNVGQGDPFSLEVLRLAAGNSVAGTNSDEGYITFYSDDSDGAQVEFARIVSVAARVGSTTKRGTFEFHIQVADSLTNQFEINAAGISTVGDVNGATIGGITTANLLDKGGTELVTGDWTFDGLTMSNNIMIGGNDVVNAGTTTFVAATTTIAGIQNQNLLDKTAIETVSGKYTFSDATSVIGGVTASNLLDKTATESISGVYTHTANILLTQSKRIGFGTVNPLKDIQVDYSSSSGNSSLLPTIEVFNSNTTGFSFASFAMKASDTVAGDVVGEFFADGSGFFISGSPSIFFRATTNHHMGFATNSITRAVIEPGGDVLVFNSMTVGADASPTSGFKLDVRGDAIVDSREVNRYAYSV